MNICKHYVSGKCKNENCKFKHVDNICRNYFFNECSNTNCKFSHDFKLNNNDNNKKIKNTETFIPDFKEPNIRVKYNEPITSSNEISINSDIFNTLNDSNLYTNLIKEIDNAVYKLWHGDSHLIADDHHEIDWKIHSDTFNYIIDKMCKYFSMTQNATRVNYYKDSSDWKPYHHDAAALKPEKAKCQNITVGLSIGLTREISFESTHSNKNNRIRINFPLKDCTVYSFGNDVNINFRHGIPKIEEYNNMGRISIIIWGYSSLF